MGVTNYCYYYFILYFFPEGEGVDGALGNHLYHLCQELALGDKIRNRDTGSSTQLGETH